MQGPRLYILMRTDLDSMNPGKGMAQAAHAANMFAVRASLAPGYSEWAEQGFTFGTTLVMGVNEAQLYDVVESALRDDLYAAVIHDSSYPIRDGAVTHLIPLDTCGYVFVEGASPDYISELSLHP